MTLNAIRQEGYQLLHDGVIALSAIEANGIRIDTTLLESSKAKLTDRIRFLRRELEDEKVWTIWKRRFGANANLTSHPQIATIMYKELGYKITKVTEKGKASTDDEALKEIDHPFAQTLSKILKYEKALGTFIKGIEREVVNGRLHPVFNLFTARTYRSSSDSPNFQNFPVRDKEIAKIIRSLFVPSPGGVIVENDFKGIEVGVSACYHKDPNFISYITTPGKDMHRDMAAQIYCIKPEDVSKDARYGAKNKFVFPQFYGDFYVACARNCWEWIEKGKLKVGDISLRDHLASKGIKELGECDPEQKPRKGTFEKHMQEIENDFWNNRFRAYGQWRKDWYRKYLNRGYFDLLTGFRVYGSFRRNQVTNSPIQGSAFHCLLWSLIQIQKKLVKYKMKSMLVGQIHDSLIGDVQVKELRDYLEIVEQVTTVDLRKHYDWLIVPLEIEYEITPSNGSWFDKREVKFKHGVFSHPDHPEKKTRDAFKFVRALDKSKKS